MCLLLRINANALLIIYRHFSVNICLTIMHIDSHINISFMFKMQHSLNVVCILTNCTLYLLFLWNFLVIFNINVWTKCSRVYFVLFTLSSINYYQLTKIYKHIMLNIKTPWYKIPNIFQQYSFKLIAWEQHACHKGSVPYIKNLMGFLKLYLISSPNNITNCLIELIE